jgi:hypothetical protein
VKTGGGAGGGAAGDARISVGGGDDTEIRIEGQGMGRGGLPRKKNILEQDSLSPIGGRNWYAIVIKLYR